MAAGTAAALAGGAVLGGIAGAQKKVENQSSSSGMILDPASQQELQARDTMMKAFGQYGDMVNAGPGTSDVTNAYNNNTDLAKLLGQYAQGGYMPSSADISASNSLGAQLYQGQQTALNQAFNTQNQNYNSQAALMGRDPNDPVFRAKLAYQQTQAQQQLNSDQGAWSTQFALSMPQQRLGYAQQQNSLLNGLASQAMANRQALASMGEGIMNDERNFRVQTATKWGEVQQSSGGGLAGALNGALAGAGTGASLMGKFGGFNPMQTTQSYGTLGANQGPQLPSWGAGTNPAIGPQQPMFSGATASMGRSFMGPFA